MNRLKIFTWAGVVFVLILGTLSHFIYGWTGGNYIVGLFTPVNESTWEHMKMVFFPTIIYGAFMNFMLSREYPCLLPALCIGNLIGTWLVAFLFYGYSRIIGFDVFILDLAVFIASVLATFWIAYQITLSRHCNTLIKYRNIFIVLVGIMAVCFMAYSFIHLDLGIFKEPA